MCRDLPPLEQAIQFHGHICPGILMGVRAAEFALTYLEADRDVDEDLLAVVETDSCGVDAIQAILGCTFGKGNLFFNDHGKNVYTVANRSNGKAVRIAQKFGALNRGSFKRYRELKQNPSLAADQKAEMETLMADVFEEIMTSNFDEIFIWEPLDFQFPPKAMIEPTIQCALCREGVKESKTMPSDNGPICQQCAARR